MFCLLWGVLLVCGATAGAKVQAVPAADVARLQSRLANVHSSAPHALAQALGAVLVSEDQDPLPDGDCLVEFIGLSKGGSPQWAFKWTPPAPPTAAAAPVFWKLFLLAWQSGRWQVRGLMSGYEPIAVRALPVTTAGDLVAVVVHSQSDDVVYPVIFSAPGGALVWDSRSDASRYEGHRGGQVQFRAEQGRLEMLETGRADPGLLVFSAAGQRGFDARSEYDWQGGAFIPLRTRYTANRDFTLYRFISALHLHDYAAAYALVDARHFLRTDKPTLQLFRSRIEDAWPEFLDDHIFKAREGASGDETFTLRHDDTFYVYTPSFSAQSPWLLTGLKRSEHKPESE